MFALLFLGHKVLLVATVLRQWIS